MRSLLASLSSRLLGHRQSERLPSDVLALLPSRRASALRIPLEQAIVGATGFPSNELFRRAGLAGWSEIEIAKLAAYVDFFSGDGAAGYHRVMQHSLARSDLDLLVVACIYCYRFDRFEEGYALLGQFDSTQAGDAALGRYLALAGYIALAGGRGVMEAVGYFDQALDQGVTSPLLLVNAYPVYVEAGRHDRVEQVRQLIHQHYADDPEAVYAVAGVELARDYYPEGFRLAEARYRMPEVARSINPHLLDMPRWQGESLDGKRLLVHGEQGYGDIVMMARYLPHLETRGATVIVDCREAALPLLRNSFPGCEFVAGDLRTPPSASFDSWTGMMSLPFHFDTTADSVPATAGYLTVPPENAKYWCARVAELAPGESVRIGLAWSGDPAHRADRRRSIPFEQISRYLRALPEVKFFSLQTAVPAGIPPNLIDTSEELLTLADTAALVGEMDLVITVDTSIVHVAGALGKPTWLLLPRRYEWRWSLEGERNNWYSAVRTLRQTTHGDWDTLLTEVFEKRLMMFLSDRMNGPDLRSQ